MRLEEPPTGYRAVEDARVLAPQLITLIAREHGVHIAQPAFLPYLPSRTASIEDDSMYGEFIPIGKAGRVRMNAEMEMDEVRLATCVAHELWHAGMYQHNPKYRKRYAEPGIIYDALDEGVALHGEIAGLRSLAIEKGDQRYAQAADETAQWAPRAFGKAVRKYRHGYRAVRGLLRNGWTLARIVQEQDQALAQARSALLKAGLTRR